MKKINAMIPAALMVLLASCSNATSDSNSVTTPPASSSSMAPPVGSTPAGAKDNVEVKKMDSGATALPYPNTADTLTGTGGRR